MSPHAPDCDAVLRLFRPIPDRPFGGRDGNGAVAFRGDAPWFGERGGNDSTSRCPEPLSARARPTVVASSRAVYGEGGWQCGSQIFYPQPRSHAQLLAGIWDPQGPTGEPAVPLPNCAGRTEPRPTNIYAATKLAQEHILAAWAAAHDTNLSMLRLQNVYGPGQSLTNSYTGIVALFARLARQQHPLEVYEDGRIVRDFVYIDDVVEALFAAVEKPANGSRCLDIGSGTPTTIHELAQTIAAICDAPEPVVVAKFRDGDVRAARCDIEAATNELGWRPKWALENGLRALLGWIGDQPELPVTSSDHTRVAGAASPINQHA